MFRRSAQTAASPVPGWDIALRLDEDLSIGANLIECIEYEDGTRSFVLFDIPESGLAGASAAAYVRGLVCSLGLLQEDPSELLAMILDEVRGRDIVPHGLSGMVICVKPYDPKVRIANAGHRPPYLIRKNLSPEMPAFAPFTPNLPSGDIEQIDIEVMPDDAMLFLTRFADLAPSPALTDRTTDSVDLSCLAQSVVAGGAGVAIDAVMSFSEKLRMQKPAEWSMRLLSLIWIRRVSGAV